MSKQQPNKKRLSLPSSSTQRDFAQPAMPMWAGPAMWNPFLMGGSQQHATSMSPFFVQPSTSAASSSGKQRSATDRPWNDEGTKDSSSDSDDFVTQTKKRKAPAKSSTATGRGRGPGRPTKAELAERASKELRDAEDKKIVESYPTAYTSRDAVAYQQKHECHNCRLYVGHIAFVPCGHGKYCFSCVNKVRADAKGTKRPSKCPADNCYELVKGWIQLFHVSA